MKTGITPTALQRIKSLWIPFQSSFSLIVTLFEISYLSFPPTYILDFFNIQIAFNLVGWYVSSA